GGVWQHYFAVLTCFKRALEIDSSNLSLWIEYGNMSYALHSFASRQLKQWRNEMPPDLTKLMEERKESMLETACKCFQSASKCGGDCNEEEWLIHYMLGKISEKRKLLPKEYLQLYKQSAHFLHEEAATYPRKITYHSPTDLALEALELFFRMAASILKLLEEESGKEESEPMDHLDYELFFNMLSEAAVGPFARGQEKSMPKTSDKEKPPSLNDEDSHSSSAVTALVAANSTATAVPMATSLHSDGAAGVTSPPCAVTPLDHDYAKRKKLQQRQGQPQDALYRNKKRQISHLPSANLSHDHDYCGSGCASSLRAGPAYEHSQDSVAVLSDSSSLQDVFLDPTSSQDSTHKLDSGKCQPFSEDTNMLMKDKAAAVEEPEDKQMDITSTTHSQESSDTTLSVVTSPEMSVPKAPAPHTPTQGAAALQRSAPRRPEPLTPPELLEVPRCLPIGRVDQRNVLVEMCVRALFLCLIRLPQHYKSLYRLAHLYACSKTHKNLQWARDLLLGSSVSWQQLKHMPAQGLFCERNKTNLFNLKDAARSPSVKGIWRIQVDEIDRPGSFASHMNRSIVLLLDVLSQLRDHDTLLKISLMLQRTPDQGKKYLRDVDRQVLAKRAFFFTVKVLEDNLDKLTAVSDPSLKPSTYSMGEMTTADVSSRPPATEDTKSSQPAKPCLPDLSATPAVDITTSGPCQPLAPFSQPTLELGNQNQGTSATSQTREGSLTLVEPMELEPGTWTGVPKPGHPQSTTDSLSHEQGTPKSVAEGTERRLESARTPELSLEELSISSKQQQMMQVQASTAHRGTHTMTTARPNRKRKLLEDVESGKTLLLDAYRVWQQGQKVMTYDLGRIEKIMSETYMLIKQVDEDVALDQAVKFCQIQMATSTQRQNSSDAPMTPKFNKEHRDIFFPASVSTPCLHTHSQPVPAQEHETKLNKTPRPLLTHSQSHTPSTPTQMYCPPPGQQDQSQPRTTPSQPIAGMAFLPHTDREASAPEGLAYRQQESHLCQQMKLATVSKSHNTQEWCSHEAATCSTHTDTESADPSKQADSSRIRSRIPPNMPKLLIPSTATKFPPEITVTPPTPTLLSPKGSISEETKLKLKNVILASQSAANVKKDTLAQPALEVQETSSQESSLDSETDEEDDYMDI
ncbi:hypothetical protein AMELA_G00286720, partial [Ameiurus melas]